MLGIPPRPDAASPCPCCGYDLRGHPDSTRCPECGKDVTVSAAFTQINRWADVRLLDLWSIGVTQGLGLLTGALAILAIASGEYAAVLLGLTGLLCVGLATPWFLVVATAFAMRCRTPRFAMLSRSRRMQLRKWLIGDALLIAGGPVVVWLILRL